MSPRELQMPIFLCNFVVRFVISGRSRFFMNLNNFSISKRSNEALFFSSDKLMSAIISRAIGREMGTVSFDEQFIFDVSPSIDMDEVMYYFNKEREKEEQSQLRNTNTRVAGFFSRIDLKRTTQVAYHLANGEHERNHHDEQEILRNPHGHSRAHSVAHGGIWPGRGAASIRGNGKGNGIRALVEYGGEAARNGFFQEGTLARAAREARDGTCQGEGKCIKPPCLHQPAIGYGWHFPVQRRRCCRHRSGEHLGKWGKCFVFKHAANLKID